MNSWIFPVAFPEYSSCSAHAPGLCNCSCGFLSKDTVSWSAKFDLTMGCYPKGMAPFSLVSPTAFSRIPLHIWSSKCTIMEQFLGVGKKVFLFFSFLCFPRSVSFPSTWTKDNMPDPCSFSLTVLLGYALHERKEQITRMWQWHGPEPCSRQLYMVHLWNNIWKNLGKVNESSK